MKRDHTVENIDPDNPKTKKAVLFNRTKVKIDILETLETHFSSWNKTRSECLLEKVFPNKDRAEPVFSK